MALLTMWYRPGQFSSKIPQPLLPGRVRATRKTLILNRAGQRHQSLLHLAGAAAAMLRLSLGARDSARALPLPALTVFPVLASLTSPVAIRPIITPSPLDRTGEPLLLVLFASSPLSKNFCFQCRAGNENTTECNGTPQKFVNRTENQTDTTARFLVYLRKWPERLAIRQSCA